MPFSIIILKDHFTVYKEKKINIKKKKSKRIATKNWAHKSSFPLLFTALLKHL